MRLEQLHPTTAWALRKLALLIGDRAAATVGCDPVLLGPVGGILFETGVGGGVRKSRKIAEARRRAIMELGAIRVAGRALSTVFIGELLGIDHSTVVLARRRHGPPAETSQA